MKTIKKIIFVIILLFCSFAGWSQKSSNASLQGTVKNLHTGKPIAEISITIKGTTIGTASNNQGLYSLSNIPVGNITVIASGIGFKTSEKTIAVEAGASITQNFDLDEDQIMLESVVVSASLIESSRKEASCIVNTVEKGVFESTGSVCLSQGLSYQSGLRVETDCQNCGFQQVRINGLDGAYSQILIDSRPVFSFLISVFGIEQIPANMIERVEVIRGGSSATFGSNAIAGTINIITREPTTNSASVSNKSILIGGKVPDISTFVNASVVSPDNRTGLVIFGSSRQRNPYDANGDGFSEIVKLDGRSMGFNSFYKLSSRSKIKLEYSNIYEYRRGGNKFDLQPHQADIAEEAEHKINTGSIDFNAISKNTKSTYKWYASALSVNRNNYAGALHDTSAYGKTIGITFISGLQYSYNFDTLFFLPATLTAGFEVSSDYLHDEILGYHRIIKQSINTQSAFLQNEWKSNKAALLVGCRFDNHSLIESGIVSPRLNARYNVFNNLRIRAGFSTGFRAPQIYEEDLHGAAIGGEISFVKNAPGLKTEQSQSYTASADYDKTFGHVQTEWLVEAFYTNLMNVFVLEEAGTDSTGAFILERKNSSGAVVKGVSLEITIAPSSEIQFQTGFTYQQSRYKTNFSWSDDTTIAPSNKMFRTPDAYGYLTATFNPNKQARISLSGIYTGPMLLQHFAGYIANDAEAKSSSFFDLAIGFSYDFNVGANQILRLSLGVKNIFNSFQNDFDKTEYRDAGYIYGPLMPRSYSFGLSLNI